MNAAAIISDYVHERMQGETIARRILLTSALAEIAPTPEEKAALLKHRAQLESVERGHLQLLLDLRARNARSA